VLIAVIRHASTEWNVQGRMQGRRDVPLSAAGRADVLRWRLPAVDEAAECVASPLSRAFDTAQALCGRPPRVEPALIEMDWGEWEGFRHAELHERYAEAFVRNAARGLDFRPPGGESPRDVIARLRPWLRVIETRARPVAAVTHNGVLRALLSMASGWDMTGKPPVRLRAAALHRFSLADGKLALVECNVPLARAVSAPHPAPPRPAPSAVPP
jgi:probable phosphoglycerate mutase